MKYFIYVVASLFFFACTNNEKTVEANTNGSEPSLNQDKTVKANKLKPTVDAEVVTWKFKEVKKSKLIFENGKEYDSKLFDLAFIGQIGVDQEEPFLIFSGRDCNECDANISIYAHSPRNGTLNVENGSNRFNYPGSERDYLTDSLLYESRAFYGEILKGVKGIVWFQKSLTEDNIYKGSIFLVKIENGKTVEEELKENEKLLDETLVLNRAGKNKEIKGISFTSEP